MLFRNRAWSIGTVLLALEGDDECVPFQDLSPEHVAWSLERFSEGVEYWS